MIQRIALAVGLVFALAGAAHADYVTATTGHGPFACTGPIPDPGYADISYSLTGHCERWRGDFDGGSQHTGFVINATFYFDTVKFSPSDTSAAVCYGWPTGPSYAPCSGQTPGPVHGSSGHDLGPSNFAFGPASVVLEYDPPCPATPGMTLIHVCAGSETPMDGSGYATAVISDGHVAPGLPRGNPLKWNDGGECKAYLTSYGLTWTRPSGYPYGDTVAAVYACP